jgi:hypothetical protein
VKRGFLTRVLKAAAVVVAVEGEAADGGLARVCQKDNFYSYR